MKRIGFVVAAGASVLGLAPLWGSAASRTPNLSQGAALIEADPRAPGARERVRAALETCVADRRGGRAAAKCAGLIAEPCLRLVAGAGTRAVADCYRWETAGWSSLLEDYDARLDRRFAADPVRRVRLRDAQAEWAGDRTRRCEQAEASNGLLGQAAAAACELKEHSRGALYYRNLAQGAGLL